MNIFVGNLSFKTTEKHLQALFEQFGPVKSVEIITDKITRRSRGFAYVQMEERANAERAIAKLNNTNLNDQSLVVNEAKPRLN